MYPFFETIRFVNGAAENLAFHQERVNHTLSHFGATRPLSLSGIILACADKPAAANTVYRCRITYNLEGNAAISFHPYTPRPLDTLAIADIGDRSYAHKYTDRNWLNELPAKMGVDEVLLTQNGLVKDATYANLAFYNGHRWVTPAEPLLPGTRRAWLLQQGLLTIASVTRADLQQFSMVKLVNAMLTWEEAPTVDVSKVDVTNRILQEPIMLQRNTGTARPGANNKDPRV